MRPLEHPPLSLQGHPGQALVIKLDAAPGAGMLWRAPPAPAGCQLLPGALQPGGAGEGGARQQPFVFSSAMAGHWTLRFELRRDWEALPQAVQPVEVTVA
jgi:hypothetical protein